MSNNIQTVKSKFDQIRKQCLERGKLFEDSEYLPTDRAIYFSRYPPYRFDWLRPKEICQFYRLKPYFFQDGGSRFDLVQGEMGDCWLVAAAACLSENKRLLQRIAPSDQSFDDGWYAGIFRFRFWQYGQWIEVIIDDRLPCIRTPDGPQLAFVHSNKINEFWGGLMEKAYAKLHGSYEALKAGTIGDATTDFTGGLVETYNLRDAPRYLDQLLFRAFDRHSLIGIALHGDAANNVTLSNGLVTGHAYSGTALKKVKIKKLFGDKVITLIRIRNPWGNKIEWNGSWSDRSSEWKSLSEEERKEVGLVRRDDGEFWMDFTDFIQHFNEIDICNLTADSLLDPPKVWKATVIHSKWQKGFSAGGRPKFTETFPSNPQFKIKIKDAGVDTDNMASFVVELMQKNRRDSRRGGLDNLAIGFVLYHYKSDYPLPLTRAFFRSQPMADSCDHFINSRSNIKRFLLTPGEYIIIPCTWEPNEEGEFMLRVFSEAEIESEKVEDITLSDDKEILPSPSPSIDVPTHISSEDLKDESLFNFKRLFKEISGEDMVVDAYELRACLNTVFKNESTHFELSEDTCKTLLALVDDNSSRWLTFNEFQGLWELLKTWMQVYHQSDQNKDGSMSSFELSSALRHLGIKVNSETKSKLVFRYANQQNMILFDSFIMCVSKLYHLYKIYKASERHGQVRFSLDEWLEQSVLL